MNEGQLMTTWNPWESDPHLGLPEEASPSEDTLHKVVIVERQDPLPDAGFCIRIGSYEDCLQFKTELQETIAAVRQDPDEDYVQISWRTTRVSTLTGARTEERHHRSIRPEDIRKIDIVPAATTPGDGEPRSSAELPNILGLCSDSDW